jgi:hypothetical protein
MIKSFVLILGFMIVIGAASAGPIIPNSDVLTRGADGGYVKIFGEPGFEGAIKYQNGTALLGGGAGILRAKYPPPIWGCR